MAQSPWGELQERPLRRFVVPSRDASPGDQGIDRCDVDDPPTPAPLDHRPAKPSRAEHAAGEIQVDQLTPLVEGHRFRGDVLALSAHVVDEDVDRSVSFQGRPARLLAFVGLADIGGDGPALPAEGADVFGRLLQAGWIAADEDDVRPCVRDRERHLPPQPATAAGDEEALPRQSEPIEDAHGGVSSLADLALLRARSLGVHQIAGLDPDRQRLQVGAGQLAIGLRRPSPLARYGTTRFVAAMIRDTGIPGRTLHRYVRRAKWTPKSRLCRKTVIRSTDVDSVG